MSKYHIPVSIITCASHTIGMVKCDTIEEFNEKAEALWESQGWDAPTTNITNKFDLNDWAIDIITMDDLQYYEVNDES